MELTKEKKDMIIKTIEVRLNGVGDATKRARLAFLVITVASCAILITLWNAYFSYTRSMALDNKKLVSESTQPVSTPSPIPITEQRQLPLHEHNRRVVVAEWARNLSVSVGLLGIDINVNELPLLGSVALTIIALWYFFSLRRENRAIVSFLRDVTDDLKIPVKSEEGNTPTWEINRDDDKWDIANLAFHGAAQSLIFVTTGTNDKPMSGENIFRVDNQDGHHIRPVKVTDKFVMILTKLIRKLILLLVFSPAITIFLSIIADYYSLRLVSPFREETKVLGEVMTREMFNKFLWENSVAIIFGFLTLAICFSCAIFQLRTSQALKDFESKLYPKPD